MDAMVSGSGVKRTRRAKGRHEDHISRLPDAVLGDIVSLLPTKDGGRTQILSTRWRHLWSSAPLNIDLTGRRPIRRPSQISGILSSHGGPGRRFAIPTRYFDNLEEHDAADDPAATLDAWLRSPALDGLQELEFQYVSTRWYRRRAVPVTTLRLPLPEPVQRFSSTLRVASFGRCIFPDADGNGDGDGGGGGLRLPLLEELTLVDVVISETSLNALLAGCHVLKSLMLTEDTGCVKRIRIVSATLRSIGVRVSSARGGEDVMIEQLIIEDAPSLERFLLFGYDWCSWLHTDTVISVKSAPKLKVLGQLQCLQEGPTMEVANSVFKGSSVVSSTTVLPSVKVLALTHISLSLDEVIAFMECFPCLENLYIRISNVYHQPTKPRLTNAWRQKYRSLIGTLDIRLKKIVLSTYLGNKAHVNFAAFFVLNARVLESMVFDLDFSKHQNTEWIEKQKTLLQIEERASRGAQFDFVVHFDRPIPCDFMWYKQTHDLSTYDPFVGFDQWATG